MGTGHLSLICLRVHGNLGLTRAAAEVEERKALGSDEGSTCFPDHSKHFRISTTDTAILMPSG